MANKYNVLYEMDIRAKDVNSLNVSVIPQENIQGGGVIELDEMIGDSYKTKQTDKTTLKFSCIRVDKQAFPKAGIGDEYVDKYVLRCIENPDGLYMMYNPSVHYIEIDGQKYAGGNITKDERVYCNLKDIAADAFMPQPGDVIGILSEGTVSGSVTVGQTATSTANDYKFTIS